MLSCEYCEILKNSIFTKYLRWLLLYLSRKKVFKYLASKNANQKQPFRGDAMKRCSENMQQIYRRHCRSIILMLQNNFIEITLRHGCSPLNLFHIFITRFPKNTWKAASNKWNQEWAYAVYGSGFSD